MENEMARQEWQFGLLPTISAAVSDRILEEMNAFGNLSEEAKRETLDKIFEWLAEANPELVAAIHGTTQGLLEAMYDPLAHKLTHAEWEQLLSQMRYAHLVVLRALNEATREKQG